ncbi:MAG TPA: mechanosensitive ion channel protein MscS [Balneolaceae bacterium]|nr:mechanosensitive ion channel protein MscS [Balneola sp.]HBQ60197.1 mechanosensitive ion channel protein MscS [Balneolaceae bacterium]|tara:strand:+ start:40492 stop:41310 length:819 start_codon:yes stop_codon:yes gene_type:complete
MENFSISPEEMMSFVTTFGPKLLAAVATLVIGLWIVKLVVSGVGKGLNKSNVDDALKSFLKSLVSILLKVMVYISALGMLGIEMTSFIAVLGAAGLAVGLALQGSLANFAGGVLILFFKPFKVGDFIERGNESGTVEKIDILHTHLQTPNNQLIVVPNGQLANSPVVNYSAKETRRAVFPVGIGYTSDVKKAREVMLEVLNNDERTLPEPAPMVVMTNLGDSSLDLSVRAWTNTGDYWGYFWDNLEKMKEELDKAGVEIPFPQRDVHLIKED